MNDDNTNPTQHAWQNWAAYLAAQEITTWQTADGKIIPVDKIGANHAYNIVLHLAEREALDPFAHRRLIQKAKSWRVFGPWAALKRWSHMRKIRNHSKRQRRFDMFLHEDDIF